MGVNLQSFICVLHLATCFVGCNLIKRCDKFILQKYDPRELGILMEQTSEISKEEYDDFYHNMTSKGDYMGVKVCLFTPSLAQD